MANFIRTVPKGTSSLFRTKEEIAYHAKTLNKK